MTIGRTLAAALVVLTLTPARAGADVLIIPYFGVNFGGDSGQNVGNSFDAKQYNWGASFAFMGGGVIGVEADLAYSPDFFGTTDAGGSGVFTGMANMLLGIPFGGQQGFGVRPYALAGIGVLRARAEFGEVFDIGENNVSWNTGGGVLLFFGTNAGIRFDYRYFRTFDELDILDVEIVDQPGTLDFSRASFGFVFRF